MKLKYSKHAEHRMQNRAIAGDMIEVVLDWGHRRHHAGACICEIAKKDIPYLRQELRLPTRVVDKLSRLRVVVSDRTVVTAMYRH